MDTDYFEAVFRLLDEDGNVTVAIKHGARVGARLIKRHSRKVYVNSSGNIDPYAFPLENMQVRYSCGGHHHIPDHEIVGSVLRFIRSL